MDQLAVWDFLIRTKKTIARNMPTTHTEKVGNVTFPLKENETPANALFEANKKTASGNGSNC